jgi:hypothetical protein
MDETTRKVTENHVYTALTRDIEKAKALFSRDSEICLTAIVSMTATGERFPM